MRVCAIPTPTESILLQRLMTTDIRDKFNRRSKFAATRTAAAVESAPWPPPPPLCSLAEHKPHSPVNPSVACYIESPASRAHQTSASTTTSTFLFFSFSFDLILFFVCDFYFYFLFPQLILSQLSLFFFLGLISLASFSFDPIRASTMTIWCFGYLPHRFSSPISTVPLHQNLKTPPRPAPKTSSHALPLTDVYKIGPKYRGLFSTCSLVFPCPLAGVPSAMSHQRCSAMVVALGFTHMFMPCYCRL